MSPEGEIKHMKEFMEEQEKSHKELLNEGYFDLSDEELKLVKELPSEDRYDAIISKRHQDVLAAAYDQKLARDVKNRKPKESKSKKRMIKASRKRNRKK